MWFLKACPRCSGDLVFEEDSAGAYLMCVQCGHVLSLAQERALGVRVNHHGVTPLGIHKRPAPARKREPVVTMR